MNDSTLDLFEEKADEEGAKIFSDWVKEEAEKIGVTEDYYILEFV